MGNQETVAKPTRKKPVARAAKVNQENVAEATQEKEQVGKTSLPSRGYEPIMIPADSILNRLGDAETGMEITSRYMTAKDWAIQKENGPIRCYFIGVEEAQNAKGKKFEIANFISGDRAFAAGQMLLVDAVRNLPQGEGIQIEYLGEKENKKSEGHTQLFSVKRLKVNIGQSLKSVSQQEEGGTNV